MTLTTDLIRLNNLPLAARLVSDEGRLGMQLSRRAGAGTEFEQFRHYVAGDDPKRIDWKRYAQTDQYLIRESATESNTHIRLLLDQSGSMNYAEGGVSRLQYAKILLASLAYVANRQSDALSLYGLHEGLVRPLVPPGAGAFPKIVAALDGARASGGWPAESADLPVFGRKQTEMLIVASDLLQVGDEWRSLVRGLAGPRREIVLFQLLGDDETDFNLSGYYRFEDLETGRTVTLQTETARAVVRERASAYLSRLDDALRLPHVRLIRARLGEPVGSVLVRFLSQTRWLS